MHSRLVNPETGLDDVRERKFSYTYQESNPDFLVFQPGAQLL
jgi:hypothetical protein